MSITSSLHKWTTRWQSLPTQHGCLSCPHMSDVSPQLMSSFNTLWLYGLTTLFLPKHLWGSLSAFCNYPQRCNLGDLFLPFALSPRLFPIGQTFVTPKLMSSSNTPWLYGLTTLFFQNIFGDHFLPFATIPKDAILGISFCLLHYPQDFHQLVKPSSLWASLGGKLCRIMVKPYLAGGSPSPGWAVSPPQGTWPSWTTNNDPCNGCLLDRS